MTDGDRPVDPLDPGLRVVERRDDLPVAERPVGAAEPGIGGAHDDADRDQQRASVARVAAASFWKRVTRRPFYARRRVSEPTAAYAVARLVPPDGPRPWRCSALALIRRSPARRAGASVATARRAVGIAGGVRSLATAPRPPTVRPERLVGGQPRRSRRPRRPGHSSTERTSSCGRDPDPVLVPRRRRTGRSARPDRTVVGRASTTSGADPATPVATADGHVRLDDRGRARHLRPRRRPPRGRGRGAPSSRPRRRGAPPRRSACTFEVQPTGADRPGRRRGARRRRRRPLADVGGDVAKISTDDDPGPGLLPDARSPTRSPRTSRSCSCSRRRSSARARSAARPSTRSSRSRRPTRT